VGGQGISIKIGEIFLGWAARVGRNGYGDPAGGSNG
jgi:hypothetical protein